MKSSKIRYPYEPAFDNTVDNGANECTYFCRKKQRFLDIVEHTIQESAYKC